MVRSERATLKLEFDVPLAGFPANATLGPSWTPILQFHGNRLIEKIQSFSLKVFVAIGTVKAA